MSEQHKMPQHFMASAALYPWTYHTSSSRLQMFGSHIAQALALSGSEPRRNQTLAEREFAKTTFSIKLPCNAEILAIIPKYPPKMGIDSVAFNPLNLVIYEDLDTWEIGCLEIPRHHCIHQHFGFTYKPTNVLKHLHVGQTLPAGTILADSPNVDEHGNYAYGLEAMTVMMSVPEVTEDGFAISESLAKRMSTKGYETRTGTWGEHQIPLNLHGTADHYKPFPDIGDRVPENGLLFAFRRYDPLLAPIDMTPEALMVPDYTFDRLVMAKPGAKVIDITVRSGARHGPMTPTGMDGHVEKYFNMELQYRQSIINAVKRAMERRGGQARLTPAMHAAVREAYKYIPSKQKAKATHMYQLTRMDDWFVEVTFEYDVEPSEGFKITTAGGGVKGVVCRVIPDEEMPTDHLGRHADIIMDADAIQKRTSLGVMFEQYTNATSDMISRKVAEQLPGIKTLMAENPEQGNHALDTLWKWVLRYYEIMSPRMHQGITGPKYNKTPLMHLEEIAKNGIYLYLPVDNPRNQLDAMFMIREEYPVEIHPARYRALSGEWVTTVEPVLFGTVYVILLEKTGEDFSAVASPRRQHFGLPAKLTKQDRYSSIVREQPVRLTGETETRSLSAYMGGEITSKILEASGDPALHRHIVGNIMRSPHPMAEESIVDWSRFAQRGSRAHAYVTHILQCGGIEFVNNEEGK